MDSIYQSLDSFIIGTPWGVLLSKSNKVSNLGCAKLGEINRDLDWPIELAAFGLLAHEQHDHENIGITAENCIPEIINECTKLVASHS
ncbi:hypothetical protein [Shewanella sp.]|uniref:hypothetical protein n=1 Tax=Shewanella sp. TaxID=50422 RepID=UPI0026284E70|nr:hypothetical protein [Shewanella sp.]